MDTSSVAPNNFRWVNGRCCGLRLCRRELEPNDEAIVLAVNLALLQHHFKSKLELEKASPGIEIDWWPRSAEETRVVMHTACWNKAQQLVSNSIERELVQTATGVGVEYFDGWTTLQAKATRAAHLVATSQHLVAFTGAGISTSAGIADFRGTAGARVTPKLGVKSVGTSSMQNLQPTLAHRILSLWANEDRLKYLITQNTDGLHAKSQVPLDRLSELHGCSQAEYCEKCFTVIRRDYRASQTARDRTAAYAQKCPGCGLNHVTGRLCEKPNCGGRLMTSVVNFGDDLHETVCGGLPRATEHARKSDVMICLGSSLTVSPANALPASARHVILCNLQRTGYDDIATSKGVRAFGTCDAFMALIFRALEAQKVL